MMNSTLKFVENEWNILFAFVFGFCMHGLYQKREPSLYQFVITTVTTSILATVFITRESEISTFIEEWAKNLLTYLSTLTISILYYRILSPLHPLQDVPGPLLAKASQLWLFSVVVKGRTRFVMQELHQKYGDVVRIGPNELSLGCTSAILKIHGAQSWVKGISYAQTASGMSSSTETSLISLRNHAAHAERRRLWDRALSMASLRSYQVPVMHRLEQLVSQFDKRQDRIINLYAWLGYFVWDVMTDLAYGGGGSMIEAGYDVDNAIQGLCGSLQAAGINKVLPWISPITSLGIGRATENFREMSRKMFLKRYEQGQQSDTDIFYHLLGENTESGTKQTVKELAADSALVIAAGADTTRLVMSSLFNYLVRRPERYKKLQEELDKQIVHDEIPHHDELVNIPLIDAYINEALRLNSAVPFANQREAPAGGADIQQYHVPQGTQVRVASYFIHRDPRNYDQPEEYRPERWFKGADGLFENKAFHPFLFGPYHCAGKQFAMQEMRLLVATIVRLYDMKPEEGFNTYEFEDSIEDRGLLEIHKPLPVKLTRRIRPT